MRPLEASHTTSDWVLCISMKLCRGGLPYFNTRHPGSRQSYMGPILLFLGSPMSYLGSLEFYGLFCHELATTPLLFPFSLSGSPWVRAPLFSRIHSFCATNQQEAFKTYLSLPLPTTPNLLLNTYMSCCKCVCEWNGQNSKFELQKFCIAVYMTQYKKRD